MPATRPSPKLLWIALSVFLLAQASFGLWLRGIGPQEAGVSYKWEGGEWMGSPLPLSTESRGTMVEVKTEFYLRDAHAWAYHIHVDDCLRELTVNGQRVGEDRMPYCDHDRGVVLDLGEVLRPGRNEFMMQVEDKGGLMRVGFEPARTDPLVAGTYALILLSWIAYAVVLARAGGKAALGPLFGGLLLIGLVGAVIRLGYLHVTPLGTRGHDIYAHTQYIEYVASQWRIPPASEGWEYHQPPLYYFATAAFAKLTALPGRDWNPVWRQLQWVSTLLSIGCLGLIAAIGLQLFSRKKEKLAFLLFCLVLATFPGLVYIGTRVSNDIVLEVVALVFFLLLLIWWRTGKNKWFWILAVLTGVSMLAKISAVLFIPVLLGCLLLREMPWNKKLKMGAGWFAIVLALAGWLTAWRIFGEADISRTIHFGNLALDPVVILGNRFWKYFVFRPWAVLAWPYNNPWVDDAGRQFYWEYFFKSAFFGEWNFGERVRPLVQSLLVLGMGCVPLMVLGIVRDVRHHWRFTIPILVTFAVHQAASIGYRVLKTCSCNQDFRFVPLLAVPFTYYAIRGIGMLPRLLRPVAVAWLVLLAAFSTLLFATVFFEVP